LFKIPARFDPILIGIVFKRCFKKLMNLFIFVGSLDPLNGGFRQSNSFHGFLIFISQRHNFLPSIDGLLIISLLIKFSGASPRKFFLCGHHHFHEICFSAGRCIGQRQVLGFDTGPF